MTAVVHRIVARMNHSNGLQVQNQQANRRMKFSLDKTKKARSHIMKFHIPFTIC